VKEDDRASEDDSDEDEDEDEDASRNSAISGSKNMLGKRKVTETTPTKKPASPAPYFRGSAPAHSG
jgi:hypothetical protein